MNRILLALFVATLSTLANFELANAQNRGGQGGAGGGGGGGGARSGGQGGRGGQAGQDGQPGEGFRGSPGGQEGGPMAGPSPLVAALDENADGEISASEIDNAIASLKSLDRNEDGKLNEQEIRPRGPGPRGEGPGSGGPEGEGPGPGGPQGRGPSGGDPALLMERLKQADTDGDGKISKEEAPERLQANFDRIDENSDGFIGEDEIRKMAERAGGRGGRRGASPDSLSGPGGGGFGAGGGGAGGGGFGSPEGFVDRLFELDANGDGNLTRDELGKMAEQFGGGRRGAENPEGEPAQGQGQRRRPQRPDGKN